jgi:hypothetical protein
MGIDPLTAITSGRFYPTVLGFPEKPTLMHDTQHFLMVNLDTPTAQFAGYAAVSVAGKFFADGFNMGDEL